MSAPLWQCANRLVSQNLNHTALEGDGPNSNLSFDLKRENLNKTGKRKLATVVVNESAGLNGGSPRRSRSPNKGRGRSRSPGSPRVKKALNNTMPNLRKDLTVRIVKISNGY